ncbi:hypothetical protein IscW_ISCW016139, partial [Ixodes scapularis]
MVGFWKRWNKEYLLQLPFARRLTDTGVNSLQAGDVVSVHEERVPHLQWRVERIEEVRPGREGH